MMNLIQLAQKAKTINVKELALNIAKKNSGLIDNAIRDQLREGKAGDNQIVGIYKSLSYARRKARISEAPFGNVDLKLSGTLWGGLNTKITNSNYETDSNVDYSKYQKGRYGDRIYKLQDENAEDIKAQNSTDIINEWKRLLGI